MLPNTIRCESGLLMAGVSEIGLRRHAEQFIAWIQGASPQDFIEIPLRETSKESRALLAALLERNHRFSRTRAIKLASARFSNPEFARKSTSKRARGGRWYENA